MKRKLAERISQLMRERAVSQTRLASEAGLSQSAISKILSGKRGWRSSHSTICAIANVLGTTPEWLIEGLPADSRSNKLKALKTLGQDIEWLPLQEDLPPYETNMCWALQLTFHRLRQSRDAVEICEILRDMRKLSFEKALKRFNPSCPGLPSMLNAVCDCCSALYEGEQEIKNVSADRLREISGSSVEVCRSLLLPYIKRPINESLFLPDAAMAISKSLGLFKKTIERYSRDWSEYLAGQLRGAIELIPYVLKVRDLCDVEIGEKLTEFAHEIPAALGKLAQEHPEKWLLVLRAVCSRRPPENIRGPLCKLWRRLLVVSRSEAFGFLRRLMEVNFESAWIQIEYEASSEQGDSEAAETVVGCIHDLVKQCFHGGEARFGFYWHSQIRPVVENYIIKRQEQLLRGPGTVHGYLEKIISMIDSLPKKRGKQERQIKIEEILPAIRDPNDSLCGVVLDML